MSAALARKRRVVTLHRLVVGVGGDVVDHVEAVLEHDPFPGAERGHGRVAGTARHQLDVGSTSAHRPGGLARPAARTRRPVLWPICHGPSISLPRHHRLHRRTARSGRWRPAGPPARCRPRRCSTAGARPPRPGRGSEVDRQHRLDPVRSHHCRKSSVPTWLVSRRARRGRGWRALLARSDAVLPDVVGHEVAAGVADEGDPELGDQVRDVRTEAVRVGGGVAGLVDAGVDAAAEVLDERPEQAGPDRPHDKAGIDGEVDRVRHGIPPRRPP